MGLSNIFLPKKLYNWIEYDFSYPLGKSNVTKDVAGLGYNRTIIYPASEGIGLDDWPFDAMAINRIKDSMGRIRLNETNLLLLFEK